MTKNVYGLDLGSYEIKIYDQKKDKIWKTKNTIAMKDGSHIFAVGDEAYRMYKKAPNYIEVIFPMQNGVISHFDRMQCFLQRLLESDSLFSGGEYLIAVPTDVTEVEKRAFYELFVHFAARAKSVRIVEKGLAAAVGMGIDVRNEKGIFIADFGGETTELSVLSSGGLVLNKLLKTGGSHMDAEITNRIRHTEEFLVGRQTAEQLRKEFGLLSQMADASLMTAGQNHVSGIPTRQSVSARVVQASIRESLTECVGAITSMLGRTPPDVRKKIESRGLYLIGGMSQMKGLSTYLEEKIGLSVIVCQEPASCSIKGLKTMLLNKEYHTLTYSMLKEDYRWLR